MSNSSGLTDFVPDVRDTLVMVPVFSLRKGFIDTVVEVFVVRKDDVSAHIVELRIVGQRPVVLLQCNQW